jgi:hypothetical protein
MNVTVGAGAVVAPSRFAAGSGQSYIGRNDAPVTVPIAASGASDRYDLVYVYFRDASADGVSVGAQTMKAGVAQGVTSTTTRLQSVNQLSNETGYAIARVKVRAGASTVVAGDITDVRTLAQPKSLTIQRVVTLPSGTAANDLTGTTFKAWPAAATWSDIAIPLWATKATVAGQINGIKMTDTTTSGATFSTANGNVRFMFNGAPSTSTYYDFTTSKAAAGASDAIALSAAGTFDVSGIQGQTVTLRFDTQLNAASTGTVLRAGAGTTAVITLTFSQDAI